MNLIILQDHQFISAYEVRLDQAYATHLNSVLKARAGDRVAVGRLNGGIGEAEIRSLTNTDVLLKLIHLDEPPPPVLPLTLVLALPRPRMLQRTLQTIATMGVQKLCLLQTNRVEKSYWQTPLLADAVVHQHLVTGLEQAKATQLPEVSLHKRFRPFVEGDLPALSAGRSCLVAHPGAYPACPAQPETPTVLAVGPEGGFISHEILALQRAGFAPVQLGQRVLRVETAVPVLIAKLFY